MKYSTLILLQRNYTKWFNNTQAWELSQHANFWFEASLQRLEWPPCDTFDAAAAHQSLWILYFEQGSKPPKCPIINPDCMEVFVIWYHNWYCSPLDISSSYNSARNYACLRRVLRPNLRSADRCLQRCLCNGCDRTLFHDSRGALLL